MSIDENIKINLSKEDLLKLQEKLLTFDPKEGDLKTLEEVAKEIREYLLYAVSQNGGHLASNLGVVELTLGLHRVFDLKRDKLLFDVGHQSYVHKLLTKRVKEFMQLRKIDGLAPFQDPSESEFDPFITGHAGSAISVGCGLALGQDGDQKVIVVVGDASVANGHSLEGLNTTGPTLKNLIVILNDNEMSIGKNIGMMSKFFNHIFSTKGYITIKNDIRGLINRGSVGKKLTETLRRMENSLKYFISPTSVAEALGYQFLAVEDGHNTKEVVDVLEQAKVMEGPIFIHVKTKKGKGYEPAEEEQESFHGVPKFNPESGELPSKGNISYSEVFGEKLSKLMEVDHDIHVITAGMVKGTGLKSTFEKYPDRCHDVGIAEGHAVSLGAGLAKAGKKPYVAIYSTFLARAYGQILHDVNLTNANIKFIVDRAGVVGEDGKTHQGIYDIGMFANVNNIRLYTPINGESLSRVLEFTSRDINPAVIRIPKGNCCEVESQGEISRDKWSYYLESNNHSKTLYLPVGSMLKELLEVSAIIEERNLTGDILNLTCLYPLDEEFIKANLDKYDDIVILEESYLNSSFSQLFINRISDLNLPIKIHKILFIENKIPHGSRDLILERYSLRGENLVKRIERCINGA